jgi:hypothetical protein
VILLLTGAAVLQPPPISAQSRLQTYVIRVEDDRVFLDRGHTDGLHEGLMLSLQRDISGSIQDVADVRVEQVFEETVAARIVRSGEGSPVQVLDYAWVPLQGAEAFHAEVESDDKLLTPLLAHQPARAITAGEDYRITVRAAGIDGLSSVEMYYRIGAEEKWMDVTLRPIIGDIYSAEIAGNLLTRGILEYYVVATDIDQRRGYIGNTGEPVRIPVLPPGMRLPGSPSKFRSAALIPGQVQIDHGYTLKGWVLRGAQATLIAAAMLDSGRWPLWAGFGGFVYGWNILDAVYWSPPSQPYAYLLNSAPGMIADNPQPMLSLNYSWSW